MKLLWRRVGFVEIKDRKSSDCISSRLFFSKERGKGMTEFQLQVNLVERMARIEEKIDHLTGLMPLLENHSERITRAEESGKSSRRRIEELEELVGEIEEKIDKAKKEIYWIAGIIVAAINFVFFFFLKAGGR